MHFFFASDAAVVEEADGGEGEGDGGEGDGDGDGAVGMFLLSSFGLRQELYAICKHNQLDNLAKWHQPSLIKYDR